jgi:hypothetical protein
VLTKDGENIVKEGYMMLGSPGKMRSVFKSRHFVLFEEGFLKYYTNSRAQDHVGTINLCLVKLIQIERALYKKRVYEFSIQETHRRWLLRVGSHEDMNSWIQVLKKIRLRVIEAYNTRFLSESMRSRPLDTLEYRRESRRCLFQHDMTGVINHEILSVRKKEPVPQHQGMMWKRGRSVRNWKKRFCVLYDNNSISYFEGEVDPLLPKKKPKGKIDLCGVAAIKQMTKEDIEKVQLPKECTAGMILHTSKRQWYLGMQSIEDLEKWKMKIGENSIFVESAPRFSLGISRSVRSGGWSLAEIFGDLVSKSMGYNNVHQNPPYISSTGGSLALNSRRSSLLSSTWMASTSPKVTRNSTDDELMFVDETNIQLLASNFKKSKSFDLRRECRSCDKLFIVDLCEESEDDNEAQNEIWWEHRPRRAKDMVYQLK